MLVDDYFFKMAFGEDFTRHIQLKDPITKQPINLTGYTAAMTVRRAEFVYNVSTVIDDPLNGQITVHIPNTDSATLFPPCPPNCLFNITITSPNNEVTSVLSGEFSSQKVTS